MERVDIVIEGENQATVFLFRPLTPRAFEWIDRHVQPESWQWFGEAVAVEHRFVEDLKQGMQSAGLELEIL